jgi:hypothetical protein
MRKLFHIGLESYQARYTYQLQQWYEAVFKRRDVDFVTVEGDNLDNSKAIVTGQVLDAHGRSYYSMTQMARLVKMMKDGEVTSDDVILFEDMYTPGIESLPYIMDQTPASNRPKVFVRCLAQTIDPDDFVHVWKMEKWMGLYEKMVDSFVDGVLATNEEMVAHMKIAGWTAPIYNISGLAFGKQEVVGRVDSIKPFHERAYRVGFAARWDQEKQPDFFMDLAEEWKRLHPNRPVEFCLMSGGALKSNNDSYMARTRDLQAKGILTIHEGLQKNEYYALLNDTRVLFNCALQDWVSNTVSEGDALGSNVLYPAYRSFPETFANDYERLYVPWSLEDALLKLEKLLDAPHRNIGKISDHNDGTIDRILDIVEGNGEEWLRMDTDYRKHTSTAKY